MTDETGERARGRAMMLRDIEAEAAATRAETGLDALDGRVLAAMAEVPRDCFVPETYRLCAFANGPLPIGHGQTISQHYIVALLTALLRPPRDAVILAVGPGSGD